jgi:glycosyltransferase involved in cell wall biosynthesis
MRIALNLLYLIPGVVGGTETYAVSLLKSLADYDRKNEYFVFVNRAAASLGLPDTDHFRRVVCGIHGSSRGLRYAWEQIVLPCQLKHYRIDLVHSLGYVGPLITHCPSVVTVPDLNHAALSQRMPATRRRVLKFFTTEAVRRAKHVLTISHFSKEEITRTMQVDPAKVTVTHLGPGRDWVTNAAWESLSRQYGIPSSFVVAFAGGSVHKNIDRLMAAFKSAAKDLPHHLVLIGPAPPGMDIKKEAVEMGIADRVRTLGYIPTAHLQPILSHADLFVLPSLYEGFGIPVLEAQKAGVAVACSRVASLPEVAGDGAVFFDPQSVDDMSRVMQNCLMEPNVRSRLRDLGNANLKRFSWRKAAVETCAVYERVLQERHEAAS